MCVCVCVCFSSFILCNAKKIVSISLKTQTKICQNKVLAKYSCVEFYCNRPTDRLAIVV